MLSRRYIITVFGVLTLVLTLGSKFYPGLYPRVLTGRRFEFFFRDVKPETKSDLKPIAGISLDYFVNPSGSVETYAVQGVNTKR